MKHDCVIKFYNSQYFYFIEISENYNDCKDTTVEYYMTKADRCSVWDDHTSKDHFCSVIDEFPV